MHEYFWIYLIEKCMTPKLFFLNFKTKTINPIIIYFCLCSAYFCKKKFFEQQMRQFLKTNVRKSVKAVWFFALSVRLDLRYSLYNANVIDDPIWLKKRYPIFSSNTQCVHVSTKTQDFFITFFWVESKIFTNKI